jgi:hypothetical protein
MLPLAAQPHQRVVPFSYNEFGLAFVQQLREFLPKTSQSLLEPPKEDVSCDARAEGNCPEARRQTSVSRQHYGVLRAQKFCNRMCLQLSEASLLDGLILCLDLGPYRRLNYGANETCRAAAE